MTSEKSNKFPTKDDLRGCTQCSLIKSCRGPVVGDNLTPDLDVLFVGEAPGEQEDIAGMPFVGRSGGLLRTMIRHYLSRYNIGITNAVKCRPPNNRTPTFQELKACHIWTEQIIAAAQPKVIVAVGRPALSILSEKKLGQLSITKLAGTNYFSKKYMATIYAVYHPAYILRNKKELKNFEASIQYLAQSIDGWKICREKEYEKCAADRQTNLNMTNS